MTISFRPPFFLSLCTAPSDRLEIDLTIFELSLTLFPADPYLIPLDDIGALILEVFLPATSLSREFLRLPRLVLLTEAAGLTDDKGEVDNRSFEPLGLSGTSFCFSRLGLTDRSELGEDLPPSVASGDATEDFRGNVLLSAGAAARD